MTKSLAILLLICLTALAVSAIPPLPTEFYGTVTDFNNNASPGSSIQAYDGDGTSCGIFSVVNGGFYGLLTCRGDDPETSSDEGAIEGENISFRYNGEFTSIMGDSLWGSADFKNVNITYPVAFCGDFFCSAGFENFVTCPGDCPQFNGTLNGTNTTTSGGGGSTGGGGSSGGGSSSSGGGGGGGGSVGGSTPRTTIPTGYIPAIDANGTGNGTNATGLECEESWVCGNWTRCDYRGLQNRTCRDQNNCRTENSKPSENQNCLYSPTCNDGIKNGFEDAIDCGGLCPPCVGCFDGVQNCHDGDCEAAVDCGGPCPGCPTCFDELRNCHDGQCEEGTDCGGPCDNSCPGVQQPLPIFVCKKEVNPLSNDTLLFFLALAVVLSTYIYNSVKKLKKVRANRSLDDLKRLRAMLSIKRRMYLFILITVTISIILYLYYYFFIMCETDYKFIWILLVMLVTSPIMIHQVIRYIEYSEGKKIKKLEGLLHLHVKQVESLLVMKQENLNELEQGLTKSLRNYLAKAPTGSPLSFKITALIDALTSIKTGQDASSRQKVLSVATKEFMGSHELEESNLPEKTGLLEKLKLLSEQYDDQVKLADELKKARKNETEIKS